MTHEVVVVGSGIGGLTVAALLASRGVNVCLLEREASVGGCVAPFEKFGYRFESGAGLYALWERGEIHDRIFAELPVSAPEVRRLEPAYVIQLGDGAELRLSSDRNELRETLRRAFPECATAAVEFYETAIRNGAVLLQAFSRYPDLATQGQLHQLRAFWPNLPVAAALRKRLHDTAAQHLKQTSPRFRQFIDAQLQLFGQCSAEQCSFLRACALLALAQHGLFSIKGGAAALAEVLAASIRKSGGTIHL